MKNFIIILLLSLSSCASVKTTEHYVYKIEWLESETVSYTNKLLAFDQFPEDALIYKYQEGKYIKYIQIYE